jgi:hypothetical protein
MRALTAVPLQSNEQRRGVDTGREGEVLAADLPIAADVAEIHPLTDDSTGDLHPDFNVVFVYTHVCLLERSN